MPATQINTAVNARLSLAGKQWCFAKVNNQSTTETIRNDDIICSHVDPEVEGDAAGRELNRFIIQLDPTVPLLEAILPHMGMSLATGVYSADLTRSSFAMVIDYGATAHSYAEAWITRWALRGGSSTMPISLELHIVATAETDAGASPAMTEGDMDFIYPYPGTLLNIASTAYEADRFTLVCDRKLIFDFNNSVYITGVGLGKRTTMLATSVPYLAANKSVYWSNKRNVSGVNVELILSNSYDTVTINMPLARLNAKGPDLLSVEESTRLPLTWEARRRVDPAVDALTVTIAAVP